MAAVPPLNPIEAAFAHLLIQGKAATEAATELGLSKEDGLRYYQRRNVQNYLGDYRAVFAERMAEYEARKLVCMKITRESISQKLMALADMPPERTKGSIDGQVAALKELAELLSLKIDPKALPGLLSAMTDEQLRGYAGTPQ